MICYKVCALASDQGWLRHWLFDIKFIDFGEGLVTVFLQNTETCKNAYKSNGNNRMFISSVLVVPGF